MKKELIIQELGSLIRTLDFIQEEQAFVKRKLIDMIEKMVQGEDVKWAEDMHQQILNRELAIQLVQKDVVSLDRQIKITPQNAIVLVETVNTLKKYKQQVSYLEQEFSKWKKEVDQKFELIS